jgi:CDP-glucose 4,6-dehydratase
MWGNGAAYEIDKNPQPHEANYLKLDCSKARTLLGWKPRWNLEKAIESIIVFAKAFQQKEDIREVCYKQINEYFA